MYSKGLKGEIKDVVGIDIKPEFPKNPEIKILIYGAGAIGFHLAYIFDVPDVKVYIYMRKT